MLEKERVLFNIESDQDVLDDHEIKKLIRILRAVEHFGSDVSLVLALHVDFLGIPPIDVYKLAAFARQERTKIYEVLRSEKLLGQAGALLLLHDEVGLQLLNLRGQRDDLLVGLG